MTLREIVRQYEDGMLTVDELLIQVSTAIAQPVRYEYTFSIKHSDTLRVTDTVLLTELERAEFVGKLESAQLTGKIITFSLHTHKPQTYTSAVALI